MGILQGCGPSRTLLKLPAIYALNSLAGHRVVEIPIIIEVQSGLLGGPTGPRWDASPARGLMKLEFSLLGGSGLCRHYRRTQTAGWF